MTLLQKCLLAALVRTCSLSSKMAGALSRLVDLNFSQPFRSANANDLQVEPHCYTFGKCLESSVLALSVVLQLDSKVQFWFGQTSCRLLRQLLASQSQQLLMATACRHRTWGSPLWGRLPS